MGVRSEVQLAAAPIGYVRVELGGRQIGVTEHLLDAAQVGAALEQMRRKGVPEQVRVHALRLEAGLLGEPAQDQEGAGAGERPAARVQEQLRPVAAIEVRAAHRDVAAQRVDRGPAERDEALLRALPERADEPVLEIDRAAVQAGRLADAEARAVHQLDERPVAHRARRRAVGGVDQALGLGGRERARQRPGAAGKLERGGGVVVAGAEQHLVPEEGAQSGDPSRDRRGGEAGRSHLGQPALELLGRRLADRALPPRRELREIAAVRVDGPRRPPRREEREEAFELRIRSEGGRSHRPSGDVSRPHGCRPAWSRATSARAAPGSSSDRRRPRAGASRTSGAGGAGGGGAGGACSCRGAGRARRGRARRSRRARAPAARPAGSSATTCDASSPSGTTRSLPPFPRTCTCSCSKSTSPRSRPTASALRSPAE